MNDHVSYGDISLAIPQGLGIYVPREDSFLLFDAVQAFCEAYAGELSGPILDACTGSGILTLMLAGFFREVHAVDINPASIAFLRGEIRARQLAARVTPILGDLVSHVRAAPVYQLACINPPYLPVDDPETLDTAELGADFYDARSLYARNEGADVLERFLRAIKPRLASPGNVFFIISSLTGVPDIYEWITQQGFVVEGVTSVHRFFEDIFAYHVSV